MRMPAHSEQRDRRKSVRVRLRADLTITPQRFEGRTHYVVKDPVSLRYFRFREREHFLLRLLDGRRSLEAIRQEFENRFRPTRLRLEEIENYAWLLMQAGLATGDAPQAARLLELRRRQRRSRWLQAIGNLLCIQIPVVDPDQLLGRVLTRVRWIFTRTFLTAGAMLILSAPLLVGMHVDAFRGRLPSAHEFFRLENLVYLWLALGAVKIVHEFGHGLTCKAFGGECHEMGLMLLCFSPCLYCDVSDAWALPGKWQRALVSFAGIGAELLLAAVAAFVWWTTPDHPFINHLCLSLLIICGVGTVLFNANPLLRFDGYFLLSDWLEVPNLRERAGRSLRRLLLKGCLGIEVAPEPVVAPWRRWVLAAYALASFLYRGVLISGALWFLYRFLEPYRLEPLAGLLAATVAGTMLARALARLGRWYRERGRLPSMRPVRVLSSGGLAVGLLTAAALLPLPVSQIRQTGLVEIQPKAAERVFVPVAAILDRLHVRDGQAVQAGEVLAEFRSPDLETRRDEARCEYDIRTAQADALRNSLAAAPPNERAKGEITLSEVVAERDALARQLEALERLSRRLVLRAPRAGRVVNPPRPEEVGRLWPRDEDRPFCVIGDPKQLRTVVPIRPADYPLLQEELEDGPVDLAASVRVPGTDVPLAGTITRLPESEARTVPFPLTLPGGGPLAVDPRARPEGLVPQSQQYLVVVDMAEAGDAVVPGTLARVKIHCRWRPLSWWLWRSFGSVFGGLG
jgi:putative peptide zinc metalloprotease protein